MVLEFSGREQGAFSLSLLLEPLIGARQIARCIHRDDRCAHLGRGLVKGIDSRRGEHATGGAGKC